MCVGILLHRFATVDLYELRGKGRAIVALAIPFTAGALVLASAPMFGTFFGKALIGTSSLELGYGWLPAALLARSILTGRAAPRRTAWTATPPRRPCCSARPGSRPARWPR